ncbi:CS domain-containing protein [Babesia ovata]|uniref:CS domain-containing protein n=1 Tax=Babesia ovata TaxID=189622 RepID=A0A2H6K832_9APIC|nr:CS domain-containing protein [Babesia ovata]GBE59109.1 CS domain-containing protein [Babesia ovata]
MQGAFALYAFVTAAISPALKWFSFLSWKPVEYKNMEAAIYSTTDKYVPNEMDVDRCISNGWWDLAKKIVLLSHEEGVDLSYRVRQSVETVQKRSNELLQLLNKHYDEVDIVKVAFQWAESPHEVFLAVKFSNRWTSPGALVVSDESLVIQGNTLKYSSMGTQSDKMKKYILELELYDDVVKSETRVSPVSMGRFTITLKKARPAVWNTLTKGNEKIPNQQIWWDMKDKHQIACDTFVEENPEEKSEL